jgi:hypothetical protein
MPSESDRSGPINPPLRTRQTNVSDIATGFIQEFKPKTDWWVVIQALVTGMGPVEGWVADQWERLDASRSYLII